MAIPILALLAPLLAGCASTRTVSGDEFAELHWQTSMRTVAPTWYYLGSDERYHYLGRDRDRVPSYRVPRQELPVARPYVYDRARSRQLLLERQAPTLYPWYREWPPQPANIRERWGATPPDHTDSRDPPGVRHDPYAPGVRRPPPGRPSR